jgi:Ca-activated chloride channel homolog
MPPFAHPDRLWLLVALLPLAAWRVRGSRRRARDWSSLGQSGRPPGDGSWGWFASMALVVLALGQPRWGRMLGPDAPPGHDVVLLVDVSRSMAAEDAVPDRLGVAIEAGSSLIEAIRSAPGNRAGVVAFAGRGVVRCPLTSHLDAAIDVLRGLRAGDVQPGGTDLGAAIDQAIGAFDDEEHAEGRTIVVFSDGEDHVGSWASAVDRLRAGGIIVHSVAIGDPDRGHPVPSGRPKASAKGLDPAAETRRSDVAFEAMSKATGGALVPLGLASADLGALFRDRIEPTARRRRDLLRVAERVERFPAFLLPAIGFGLTACWPGLARRRGRRLAYSALAVALLAIGAGPPAETAAGLVARGQRAYASGQFAEALEAFDRAIELEPEAAVPRFDAASALFQLRRFPEAITRYEEARSQGDAALSIKVDYALGNAQLALGDVAEALARYDACLATTLGGEAIDAVRSDAAANREFAAKRLKPPPESPESGGPNPSGSKRNRPSSRSSKGDRGDADPSGPPDRPSPADDGPGGPQGGPASNSGARGAGGAGGGGQAQPPGGSPEARLDSALDDVREARRRRPPDPPPPGPNGVGKDW